MAQVNRGRVARMRARALGRFGLVPSPAVLVAVLAVVGAFVMVAVATRARSGAFMVVRGDEAPASSDVESTPASAPPAVPETVVHVDGAVRSPGVYPLSLDSPRVNDAVAAAGGLADDADTAAVNLAAPVADGAKVHVPTVSEGVAPVASVATRTPVGTGEAALVNINTAGPDELQTLPGVGAATAAAIIEEREGGGPFSAIEDLMRVSGIGERKFEKIRDRICV